MAMMYNEGLLPPWSVFLAFVGGFYLIKKLWTLLSITFSVFLFKKRSSNSDTRACDRTSTPSSSSSSSSDVFVARSEYEVFLSFRGSDTRTGFTDYLYTSLVAAGIRTFRDNEELRVGEEIGGSLLKAMNQSKIFIPIFSKDYASSKWCLKEVDHIVKCRSARNQLVLPIFYDATPHQVRHQSGTYEEAFKQHSERYDENTVQDWRNALAEIGALKGWDMQDEVNRYEGELVNKVVLEVWRELKKAHLALHDSIVGVEDSIEEIMEMLQIGSSDVRIVGLYGIGGIGKTTLAKIIYNQLLEHFEHSSFLRDIREMSSQEKGLEKLQTQLACDILKSGNLQHNDFANVDEGIKVLSERFQNRKVLILLDDVEKRDQINALADLDWFAGGSRIIVTTRDKGVLDLSQVRTYEVRPMHINEALLLFWKQAFRRESPAVDYVALSKNIVETTGGLPLALEIIGSFLYQKPRSVWEETLEKLQNGPYKDVRDKLRISYEALEYEEKQIFLDIACFFIGTDKRITSYMWRNCQFYPDQAIELLLQRCLIKVGDDNKFWMHDQLRDLGREIVRKEDDKKPGERSRLWSSEVAMCVLHYQQGTENIEAIYLDFGTRTKDYCLAREQFMKFSNLRFLRLNEANVAGDFWCSLPKLSWLQWHYCHVELMTTSLPLMNLIILDLSNSNVTYGWSGWNSRQLAIKLKVLILESCQNLVTTPDLSKFQSLERLSLEDCKNLYMVDPSLGKLKNLIFLSLKNCSELRKLPQELSYLQALVELHIDGSGIQELPTLEGLKNLELLNAKRCKSLSQIPSSIGHLTSLLELSLDETNVCTLPGSIGALVKLRRLSLKKCYSLRELPDSIGQLTSLMELCLSGSSICTLQDSIGELSNLRVLLVNQTKIMNLPSTLGMLEKLEVIDASGCTSLQGEILIDLVRLCSLTTLKLEWTNITMLPVNINSLSYLQTLHLAHCYALQTLPQLPSSLRGLSVTCKPIETLPDLSIYTNLLELRLMECSKLKKIPGLGSLTFLKSLLVSECQELAELDGLEKLECTRDLSISWCKSLVKLSHLPKSKQLKTLKVNSCKSLQSIPNLSVLKMLRHLSFEECDKLCVVEGLGELESLEHLNMKGCKAIRNIPNLLKLGKLKELVLAGCTNLTELQGLEELKSLKRVDIRYSPSLYHYIEKWPHIPWEDLPRSYGFDMLEFKAFLNFRGQDITGSLFNSLSVSAYRDDGELSECLLEAIYHSVISIPIFSKGYAFSIRCLQELAYIVECRRKWNQTILPIFYDVVPDQVLKQSGSYEEAFKQHMEDYDSKIVESWRAALREVAALKGWELQHVDDEHKDDLVKKVLWNALANLENSYPGASEYIVGIDNHVEEVMKLLEINANDVRIVGIHGMAGVGKTTLAKVIYNQLKEHFVYHSFLVDIRGTSMHNRGLEELQSQLLLDILRPKNPKEFEFASVDEGINVLRHVNKKVLIVVDDVEKRDQLDALVPYNGLFAPGSRIVVTTRNKNALDMSRVGGNYELNMLRFGDALALFYKHAFRWGTPLPDFITLSHEIVSLSGGLPLAVEVLSSFLCEQDKTVWEHMLRSLRKTLLHNNVQSKLRISYEELDDTARETFHDIACFFIGTDWRIACYMWEYDGFYKEKIIEILHSLSLVKIVDDNVLWMHDQLRDLGREIVRRESDMPGKRSRLWHSEEAIEVVNYNKGTKRIEAICLDYGARSEGCFWSAQFRLLPNLRFLQLNKANIAGDFTSRLSNLKWLRWNHCPDELLATNLYLERLVVLELSESNIIDDWSGWRFIQKSIYLKVVILRSCQRLTKTPVFNTFPMLEILKLDDCTSLEYIDPSIGSLENLEFLSVKGCSRLKVLPGELSSLRKLTKLYIDGTRVKEVPTFNNLQMLSAGKCESLSKVPDSIGALSELRCLSLNNCKSLRGLPNSIGGLARLKHLNLSYTGIGTLPDSIGQLCFLEELDVSHSSIHALPDSIGEMEKLKVINVSASNIEFLPSTLGKLEKLQVINASYCRNLNGEMIVGPMRLYSLRAFILEGTNLTLPPSISGLLHLRSLDWAGYL